MSFGSGDPRKRPGIFESFRTAMTPKELPPDDGKPLVPPPTIRAATIISILVGVVFVLIGGGTLFTVDSQLEAAVTEYNNAIKDCVTQFGGIGDAAKIPAGSSDDVTAKGQACQSAQELTDDMISSYKTRSNILSLAFVLIGLVAVAGGWFIRKGAGFGRLMSAGAVVVLMLLALFLGAQSIIILAATLLLIVAVMLCFIGKGAMYFARVKARRIG
jgi:hypothetical protein